MFNLGTAYPFYIACQLLLISQECWEHWVEKTQRPHQNAMEMSIKGRSAEKPRVPGIFITDLEHKIRFHFL